MDPATKYARPEWSAEDFAIIRVAAAQRGMTIKAYVALAAIELARKETQKDKEKK